MKGNHRNVTTDRHRRHPPGSRHYLRTLDAISLLLGIAALLASSLLWYRLHMDIPERDTVPMIHTVQPVLEQGLGGLPLDIWLHPHFGSHRIPLIRLLQVADLQWAHGSNAAYYGVSLLSIFAMLAFFTHAARAQAAAIGVSFPGLALLFLFSPSQIWNFIQPIGASWLLSLALVCGAYWLLLARPREPGAGRICAVFALLALASWANFTGLVALLLLPLMVGLMRRAGLVPVLVATLLWTGLYLQGVAPMEGSLQVSAGTAARSTPAGLLAWLLAARDCAYATLTFFSAPFSAALPRAILLPSLAALLFLALQWARVLRPGAAAQRGHLYLLCLALATICLGTALAIFLGRIGLTDLAILPHPPRYRSLVLLFWLSIGGLALARAGEAPAGAGGALLLRATCLALGCAYLFAGVDKFSSIVSSSQLAARNTSLGVLAIKPLENPADPWLPPPVARLSSYHDFFLATDTGYGFLRQRALAFRAPAPLPECPQRAMLTPLKAGPGGLEMAALKLTDGDLPAARRIYLRRDGELLGAFYPYYPPRSSAVQLLSSRNDSWRGFVDFQGAGEARDLLLITEGPLGSLAGCRFGFAG